MVEIWSISKFKHVKDQVLFLTLGQILTFFDIFTISNYIFSINYNSEQS